MAGTLMYVIAGYLLGSILFARCFAKIFHKPGILENSKDQNPGTANAFLYGGIICGIGTLVGDMAKGAIPVMLYMNFGVTEFTTASEIALVLAAPVIGHIFPVFNHFKGGKGIATTFGCLLGFFPNLRPVLLFAMIFILFSVVLRITPHFSRTIITYLTTMLAMVCLRYSIGLELGFLLMSVLVILRMHMSKEVREKTEVKLLWMH